MGTERMAEFIAGTEYGDIPGGVVEVAKEGFIDYLGVALAGSGEPASKMLAEYVKELNASSEATVFCKGFKTAASLAAWVNGTMAHALDYDDCFANVVRYNLHPSVPILAAVLALGEKYKASGRDILAAYIVGLEIEYRLGAAIGQSVSGMGWHPTPVLGTIAAAAASTRILKLNTGQTRMALGIAASLAGGLMRNIGTNTKAMHAGNAARNGVEAALLAEIGFTSNQEIFDGDFSFCNLFSGGKINDPGDTDADLGDVWDTMSLGLAFKLYPSCRSTNSSVDAILYLREKFGINADQVAQIICKTSPVNTGIAKFHEPKTGYEGKFSMTYCIARALLDGKLTLGDFVDERVEDSKARELMSRVTFVHTEGGGAGVVDLGAEITLKLKDGKEYSHGVALPKGEPENPMTDEGIYNKFRDCAGLVLPPDEVERVLEFGQHLDELADVTKLMAMVSRCKA